MNDSDRTLSQSIESREHAASQSQHRDPPPAHIAGYTILHCLGEGAFGSVWLAQEHDTRRYVAIKFFTNRRGLNWALLNREVEKLVALDESKRVVNINKVGLKSEVPYYIMDYLENGSLASFLADGPLPVHEAVQIARAVLQALIHTHGSGILHCDLKPANVLLDSDFEPRLCDFGQARLSGEQSASLGTLFYMAPEQAKLDAIPDARWDVYALGALLYQMLRGHAPYRTEENEKKIRAAENLEERLEIYRNILKKTDRPTDHHKVSGVDKRLAEIIDRCLQTNPQKRFSNAQAVFDALEQRDRSRARRPMLVLGIIGPILLFAAMYPMAKIAMDDAVETARENTIERALESDSLSANILAKSIDRDLRHRTLQLEEIARDLSLRNKVANLGNETWEERDEIFTNLMVKRDQVDQNMRNMNRSTDLSWFISDIRGFQRWRQPYSINTFDKNYSHRDYFHGNGTEYPKDKIPANIKPIKSPHISLPFRSEATQRLMVAISVPIHHPDDDAQVIGVLARTIELDELAKLGFGSENIERVAALVEHHDWTLLSHPWMTKENLTQLKESGINYSSLSLSRTLGKEALENLEEHRRIDNYIDPVGSLSKETNPYQGDWLAALSPVGDTSWMVIVQERKRAVMQPVEELKERMVVNGVWAVVISLMLMLMLWLFVVLALTDRRERLAFRSSALARLKSGGSASGFSNRSTTRNTPSS